MFFDLDSLHRHQAEPGPSSRCRVGYIAPSGYQCLNVPPFLEGEPHSRRFITGEGWLYSGALPRAGLATLLRRRAV